jgi:hypothetical protein
MATPVKTKTQPINLTDTSYENDFVRGSSAADPLNPGPTINQKIDYQDKPQTGNPFVFVVLAIAVLIGGYYLYTTEWPSTGTTTSTITKTDMAPAANAPATSTTVAPAAPMAATPPATDTPAAPVAVAPPAPVPATPPAAGTTPAPATTTSP